MTRLRRFTGALALLLGCQAKPNGQVSGASPEPRAPRSASPPFTASASPTPTASASVAPDPPGHACDLPEPPVAAIATPGSTVTAPSQPMLPGPAASWNRAFAARLLREFPGANNVALSPLSVQLALAMTWAGSRGVTSQQMATALQVRLPPAKAHAEFGKYAATLSGDPTLALANRIFVERSAPMRPEFQALLEQHYAAGSEPVDFSGAPEPARQRINEWVGEATRQEIKELLPGGSLSSAVALVLVNAAFFKGSWVGRFDEKLTRPAAFSLASGEVVEVPTMQGSIPARQAVLENLGARALELDYAGDRFSMVILLPTRARDLAKLERSLTPSALENVFKTLQPARLEVMLPRFSIDSEPLRLKPALERLGMPVAFTNAADFSGMSAVDDDLYINEVYHRARVRVDEAGTVAAAATGVVMMRKSAPERPAVFRVDHPFLFIIRDKQLDSVLFLGRVGDPRS